MENQQTDGRDCIDNTKPGYGCTLTFPSPYFGFPTTKTFFILISKLIRTGTKTELTDGADRVKTMTEEAQDSEAVKKNDPHDSIEPQIKAAMISRVSHFKEQAE